ncbi:pentapeptide repeat-containing protein [Rhizobium sp. P44RR-XXIV]|nr:pentapeptide repeat-containing protein [Rhizobium sp. P44RR-XXIV]
MSFFEGLAGLVGEGLKSLRQRRDVRPPDAVGQRLSVARSLDILVLSAVLLLAGASMSAQAGDCGNVAAPGLDWSKCSKTNIMLQSSDLHGANLAGAHFDSTDLSDTNLTSANLEKATLVRTWLKNVHADGANFKRIEAYRSDFSNASANGASFANAELQRAEFGGAKLNNADFQKAELGRADFDKAVLSNVNFSFANLSRATLAGAVMQGPVSFSGAFMYLTRIEGLDLSNSTGLQQAQINLACGDTTTKLPSWLSAPSVWPCPPDDPDDKD